MLIGVPAAGPHTIEERVEMLPTQPSKRPKKQKQNIDDETRAAIEGYAIDGVGAEFVHLTIQYAMSFRDGSWRPDTFRRLFQVRNEFTKN